MQTLLISSAFGIFWLILLFALCFIGVHVLRLARMGQTYRKEQNAPKNENTEAHTPSKQEDNQEEKPEPVYYIVERKKRVKSHFTEPKQIRFK